MELLDGHRGPLCQIRYCLVSIAPLTLMLGASTTQFTELGRYLIRLTFSTSHSHSGGSWTEKRKKQGQAKEGGIDTHVMHTKSELDPKQRKTPSRSEEGLPSPSSTT